MWQNVVVTVRETKGTNVNDLTHVGTLFLIFALALALYAAVLAKTGNKNWLPYRAIHTVRGPEDVKYVGRVTLVVAAVIGAAALLVKILAG